MYLLHTSISIAFDSVLRTFQDYFNSYETGQSVGEAKTVDTSKNQVAPFQTELGLSLYGVEPRTDKVVR